MTRGILSSCYADIIPGSLPNGDGAAAALTEIYRDFYRGETLREGR